MECLLAFQRGKEMLVSGQQKGQLDKMALTLDVKEKDLTIANQNLEIAQKKRRIEVLSLLFLLAVLMTIAMFIYFVNMRSFRRKLFLKEKELDQFTVDVRNWMEWKKYAETGY
jgi:hypothetical protein